MTVTAAVYDSAQAVFRPFDTANDARPDGLSATYEHVQASPHNVWAITDNLGTKLVEVFIFTPDGRRIIADPDYAAATPNYISVNFYAPQAGVAYVRSI